MTTIPAAAAISPNLLGSTQGQWWSADYLGLPEAERRVSLVSSWKGFHIWTADFRNQRSGRMICQKFFAAMPQTNQVVAVFDTVQEREAWFNAN